MKRGEKIFFGISSLLVLLAIIPVVMKMINKTEPRQARDYYLWNEQALKGYELYKKSGCNSCHRVLRMGEAGVAPVLDGEGTRRSEEWLTQYFRMPAQVVKGSAHDGRLGPDFRKLDDEQRIVLVKFMKSLRSNPGSSNYPVPPDMLERHLQQIRSRTDREYEK